MGDACKKNPIIDFVPLTQRGSSFVGAKITNFKSNKLLESILLTGSTHGGLYRLKSV